MRHCVQSKKIGFSAGLAAIIYVLPAPAQASETVTHQYDELGRLISSSKSGGPATASQTTTAYDPAGNRSNQTTSGVSGGGTPPPPPPPPPSGNLPPVANADSVSVMCNATTTVNVTANDTDPEGNLPLTVLSVTLPPLDTASATVLSASTIQVTGATFAQSTAATYSVKDSLNATATGNLTIITTGTFAQCSQ